MSFRAELLGQTRFHCLGHLASDAAGEILAFGWIKVAISLRCAVFTLPFHRGLSARRHGIGFCFSTMTLLPCRLQQLGRPPVSVIEIPTLSLSLSLVFQNNQ